GGDTSLRGATVTGGQIVASVGGDLTIESRFDTARYRESILQAQGRFGGGGVSGGASRGSVRGDSATVAEQSGLIAGAGGYQLSVGGGVNLIGGLITATADPSQNRLSADRLTFSDLVGSTRAMSSSMGLSIGSSEKDGLGLPLPQVGMPVQQSSSGFARATLSPGTLELRNQGQDLSGLNRDASAANRPAQPYDIERLQARQRNVVALSELLNIGVGHLSKELGLTEGSAEKTVLHAAVGALTAQLAGGNVASGALAGAASEVANGVLQQVLRANPNLTDAQQAAITQWVGAAVGALAGGQLGAATGFDNVTHNYLNHDDADKLLRAKAACQAGNSDACAEQTALEEKDAEQQARFLTCKDSSFNAPGCGTVAADAAAALSSYSGTISFILSADDREKIATSSDNINRILQILAPNGMDKLSDQEQNRILVAADIIAGDFTGILRIPTAINSIINGDPAAFLQIVGLVSRNGSLANLGRIPSGNVNTPLDLRIPSGINYRIANNNDIGIAWTNNVSGIQGQGMPFEDFLATELSADSRLPPGFRTIDFFDENTGLATSAKTLNTMTQDRIDEPAKLYYSLKSNIDDFASYTTYTLTNKTVKSTDILSRDLQVAVPAGTTEAQWAQIQRASNYASSQGINLRITVVR
ncbi:hemagglutinin repeat-containing protein, partial [Methylobacterium brachiatum]|uniref:endonuclease toxin domain-containing protein n=1 Tax=Methylobacterium brachiatum TaxID=269660 RepID=UPI0008E21E19